MTTTEAEITSPSLGQSGSSEASPFDELPPDIPVITGNVLGPDTRPEDLPICPVCGDPIIRDPSWKRMRKYHPGCSPSANKGDGSTGSGGRSSKASKEADEVVAMYRSTMVKVALGLSVFDKYDAFVVMSNLDGVCTSLHGVLMRYDAFRKECLAVKGGGSVFGLLMSMIMMAAPIAAHHGLIPGKQIPKLLIELPFTLFSLTQRLKDGEEGLTRIMEEQVAEMKKANEAAEARRQNPSPNGRHAPYVPGVSTVGPS